jgi:HK97 family phage prohead protease
MGGWKEIIEPTALRNAKLDDLVATVDHAGVPIGRYPVTLDLEDRTDGLHWSVVPPESGSDVREAIERGDLKAGSWRMVVGREEWRGDVRHVHEIAELRDVSVVSHPSYPASTVELRSAPTKENEMEEVTKIEERSDEQRSEDEVEEVRARTGRLSASRGAGRDLALRHAGRCISLAGIPGRDRDDQRR